MSTDLPNGTAPLVPAHHTRQTDIQGLGQSVFIVSYTNRSQSERDARESTSLMTSKPTEATKAKGLHCITAGGQDSSSSSRFMLSFTRGGPPPPPREALYGLITSSRVILVPGDRDKNKLADL